MSLRKKGERNLGIDFLRIVAMVLICAVHVYNRGGVAGKLTGLAAAINYPVRILCMTAVNLYALISGYVMVEGRFRPGRFLELWLQVVFIGLIECLIWQILSPEAVSWENWRTALLPVTQYEYWYFTAYAGVFLLSPLLNKGLRAMNERQIKALMCGIFALFSLGWLLGKMFYGDSFHLSSGYSFAWLLLIYILGAGMRRTGFLQKTPAWLLLAAVVLSVAALDGLNALLGVQSLPEEVRGWSGLMLNYCNPLTVVISLCLLALFARLPVRGAFGTAVKWLSPLTFGVYIIHVHPAAWSWLDKRYLPLTELPPLLILPAVLAAALGLFLFCALLDWLRSLVFRLVRVRRLCDSVETRILSKLTINN